MKVSSSSVAEPDTQSFASYSPLVDPEPPIAYPAVVDGQPCYVYLPPAPRRFRRPRLSSICSCFFLLFVLCVGVLTFFCWPRSLDVSVGHMDLAAIHFSVYRSGSSIPRIFVNISLNLQLSVKNSNFFGVTYDSVNVSIFYQGDEVGEYSSSGGDLQARTYTYVNASLELSGHEIDSNVLSLLEDVESGSLPLRTITQFDGSLTIFWFDVSLEGIVSCDIVVDPQNQAVLDQECDA